MMDSGQRDRLELEANTLRMFAVFFGVLSAFVLLGTAFATEKASTIIISLAGSGSLAVVSVISRFFSRRIFRQIAASEHQNS